MVHKHKDKRTQHQEVFDQLSLPPSPASALSCSYRTTAQVVRRIEAMRRSTTVRGTSDGKRAHQTRALYVNLKLEYNLWVQEPD